MGRKIVDGAKNVRVFGEPIAVKARVSTIGGFSAHADQSDLLAWIGHFENPRMRVFVIHGERSISEAFANLVRERFGFDATVPGLGDIIPLAPLAPKVAVPPAPEGVWPVQLTQFMSKLGALKSLWDQAPGAIPAELLENLEAQLRPMEAELDTVLQRTGRKSK